jgi:hypothetical protein
LSFTQTAKLAGYTNMNKGIRRIEDFERTGNYSNDLLARLAAALKIRQAIVQRLYHADYRDWLTAMNKPVKPYMVRRMLFGGGVRYVPEELTTMEEIENAAADFARQTKMEVCLILSHRIKMWFASDGSVKEVIEAVPGGER